MSQTQITYSGVKLDDTRCWSADCLVYSQRALTPRRHVPAVLRLLSGFIDLRVLTEIHEGPVKESNTRRGDSETGAPTESPMSASNEGLKLSVVNNDCVLPFCLTRHCDVR